MYETLFHQRTTVLSYRTGPLAAERLQYLQYWADHGAPIGEQRKRAWRLLRIAERLVPADRQGVNAHRLHEIVYGRPAPGPTIAQPFLECARAWLKFLGWWRNEQELIPFAAQLQGYLTWMRQERGLSPATISGRDRYITSFLRWCGKTGRDLASLCPDDLDAYFASFEGRYSRISLATMAMRLRVFLRYAVSIGVCRQGLPDAIWSPRIYRFESLPYALSWDEVRKLLASAASASPLDVRDRAILMLLAIYGLRRSEVSNLRLDQIDWAQRRIRIHRLKRRQAQVYPLQQSVAEALSRYIDTVRPNVRYPQVFIRLQAPRQPVTDAAIYHVVSKRLRTLGIKAAHLGPHALRHTCATKLLAERLTLKEIGDHLGHRSTAATWIYTKVDLAGLREVGDFDLGELP